MKIEVKNVSKSFKNVEILHDVSMSFESGNIYSLVGTNGSGKSVFLKILCGFYNPTSGEILQDSVNYIKNKSFPKSTRCLIEKPQFLPELSGLENLQLLASIQNNITNQEILDTLKLVHLDKEQNKKYSNYSLGMKQKLGIAQVLMEDPELIILDEPFNGIEKQTAIELRNVLKDLANKNKIIVIASHIEEDIKKLSDQVFEFDSGTVTRIK